MPDRIITIPNVGDIAFPDSMSEGDVNAAAQKLYARANTKSASAGSPSSPSLWAKAASELYPVAQGAVSELATNPAVKTAASAVARTVAPALTLAGAAYSGAQSGGPLGALTEGIRAIPAAAVAGWAAGKPAYRTARFLQNAVGVPLATAMDNAAPFVAAANPLMAVQSGLDLAQQIEPNRKDIGVLGFGKTTTPAALLSDYAMKQTKQPLTPAEGARGVAMLSAGIPRDKVIALLLAQRVKS